MIVKQIASHNDKWYVKYNRDSDTYYIGKEDEKNIIVIDSSDGEEYKIRRMIKRKNKESIDEISQRLFIKQKKKKKLQQKKSQIVLPETEPKKKKRKEKQKQR